jgi:FkbM family methyltransferase
MSQRGYQSFSLMRRFFKRLLKESLLKLESANLIDYSRIERIKYRREKKRVLKLPRYIQGDFMLFNKSVKFCDSISFLPMMEEIFERQIYNFKTTSPKPYIIDCGANIGLSILYFKYLYPYSKILAFEPDPDIFEILKFNIKQFDFSDVELLVKGVWNSKTQLNFFAEGADAGRISTERDSDKLKIVETVRLRDYLNKHVDFLKIDIEGAETIVLKDCADLLTNVDKIFVEYHSFVNQEQCLHDILKILSESGFRYYIQNNGANSQSPYLHIDTYLGMDNQLNIFGYRT